MQYLQEGTCKSSVHCLSREVRCGPQLMCVLLRGYELLLLRMVCTRS